MGRLVSVVAVALVLIVGVSCVKHHATSPARTSTLVGKVVDKNGNGLVGVQVTSMPGGFSTNTVALGGFTLPNMEAGEYQIFFHLVDYRDTVTDTVEIGHANELSVGNVKLTYRFGTVSGQVVNLADTSNPTPIGQFAGIEVENQNVSDNSTTGLFRLVRVEPGSVNIYAAAPGVGVGKTLLSVAPESEIQNVLIFVGFKGGTVTGRVVDNQDNPVLNAVVSAVDGALRDTTDVQGMFTISGIPEGVNIVLTITSGQGTVKIQNVQVAAANDTLDVGQAVIAAQVVQNNITLTPSQVVATDMGTVTIFASASTVNNVRIDRFLWDTDNDINGTFDDTTASSQLVLPQQSVGPHTIRVKAVTSDNVESGVVEIRLTIVAGPITTPPPPRDSL